MSHFDTAFPKDFFIIMSKKIHVYILQMAHYQYKETRSFGTRTSNSSEVEGGVLKHHGAGPKPNHSIAKAAVATVKVSNTRITLKQQKAAKARDSTPVNVEEELLPLYQQVTHYCSDIIAGSWRRRTSKTVFRSSSNVFWVKQKTLSQYSSDPRNYDEFIKYLTISFIRTHVVEVFSANGTLLLKCSCCGYEQNGYICDCICAIVNEAPSPKDVAIHWHKDYYVAYLNGDPALNRAFDNAIVNENPGPVLPADSVETFRIDLAVGQCTTEHPREYFESSLLSTTPKLHPGTKWANYSQRSTTVATTSSTEADVNQVTTGFQVQVALSQAARQQNESFLTTKGDNEGFLVDNENEGGGGNDMNESIDTYATKSPERANAWQVPPTENSPIIIQKATAYSKLKPKFESMCNAIGSDTELTQKVSDMLDEVHAEALLKHCSKSNSANHTTGIQSYPAMDRALKSKRLESCPTGSHAAGKKRVAKKPPANDKCS
jgi:hypothetical protein